MNFTRKIYATRSEKTIDFLIGFFGWFILNAILSAALYALSFLPVALGTYSDGSNYNQLQSLLSVVGLICNALIFFGNIGLLIYFGLTRYWIALGALSAFAAVLVLVTCAAIFLGVTCLLLLAGTGNGVR